MTRSLGFKKESVFPVSLVIKEFPIPLVVDESIDVRQHKKIFSRFSSSNGNTKITEKKKFPVWGSEMTL